MRAMLCLLILTPPSLAQTHIAPTDAKSPVDELASFTLPPGFVAQLVASEPDIGKPIQIAFDATGRLWVTTSRHYPFPAASGERPSDKLYVLSDIGPDGKAGSVTVFADDLNIPIGILPLPDGQSCLVSHVGSILKLTDTNGDGKADQRETILTGFGSVDTHGMMNSFVLLPDGWVYACHGFRNDSTVTAKDGSTITMNSGNTFRFRPDGSRVEPWTFGQVNPFGMTVDPWLNLYTADCHSKPITQLIRGATYQSFAKPHDGLGFAPHVTDHHHGSTALCGLAWYDADHFPKEWIGCLFLGNVVTNRVNADRIEWRGSTPVAKELPDFLVSSDPWFRPTDIKLGPEGALYVADFYNRIIGHYEVDLKHPGRDKDRGRIWRIVWQGPDRKTVPLTPAQSSQLSRLSRAGSVSAAPVLTIRQLASQALWRAEDRATVIRALIPNPALPEPDRSILVRAAVEALVAHPHPDDVPLLVKLIQDCPQDDTHLRHAARVALRNALRDADGWVAANEADPAIIADVALGVPSAKAASYLLEHLSVALDPRFCEHIGRYGNDTQAIHAAESLAARPPSDVSRTLRGLQALARGVAARGAKFPAEAATQAEAVCEGALRSSDPNHWSLAAELASLLKLVSQYGQLVKLAGRDGPARGAVFSALVAIDPVQSVPTIAAVLMDPATAAPAREQAAQVLGVANTSAARDALIRALPTAPATLAGVIAAALISSPEGAAALLDAVQAGKASARLLQDKAILGKLQTIQQGKFKPRIAELTRGLPSPDAKLTQLLKARLSGFDTSTTDPEVGRLVFARHCANCHQLGGQGAKVGPQLDGIGNRGVERLMEDILDPNRNVDEAFRAVVLDLADGRSVTGLLLREEGQVLIVADQAGRELRIPGGEVEKRTRSLLSPMPSNLDTVLTEPEFYHLVRYLLNQQVK